MLALAAFLGFAAGEVAVEAQTRPEYLRPLSAAEARTLRAETVRLSRLLGVREATLDAIAAQLGRANVEFSEVIRLVGQKAKEAAKLQGQLVDLRRQLADIVSPDVRSPAEQALMRANSAFEQGRFEDADRELGELERLRKIGLASNWAGWIDAVEARAGLAEIRLDYDRAAELRMAAAPELRRIRVATVDAEWQLYMSAAKAKAAKDALFGNQPALEAAIRIYEEHALPLASEHKKWALWAVTQTALGDAQVALGTSQSMERGVQAYLAARSLYSQSSAPTQWANIQHKLGLAFRNQAGAFSNLDLYKSALRALRQAAEVRSRDKGADDWAETQIAIADTLRLIGEMETGLSNFKKAETILRGVADLYSRTERPLDWAVVQTTLGATLVRRGEAADDAAAIREAVDVFAGVTQAVPKDKFPLAWAANQGHLGVALLTLGNLDRTADPLRRAIASFDAALAVETPERSPTGWAKTSIDKSMALLLLGEMEEGTVKLDRAVELLNAVLEVLRPADQRSDWLKAMLGLGRTLASRARKTSRCADAEAAVASFERANQAVTDPAAIQFRAIVSDDLTAARRLRGQLCG